MQIIRYNEEIKVTEKKLSVAMGNFDGLHLGHRSVIELAKPINPLSKFGVLTFEPHPREFFSPKQESFRLMTQDAKQMTLEKLGLDVLLEVPFTREMSELEPSVFIKKVLLEYFKLEHVVIGEDFKFGYQRKGDARLLKILGNSFGIKVTIAPLIKSNKIEISSTAIREALKNGDPRKASKMLGDWYSIVGTVIEGDKRGRNLGYPTINLGLSGLHLPKFGVYSAIVKILTGSHEGSYSSVVSIGERPTYGTNHPNLEAHLFNFSDDIYGEKIAVSLISFQRPEIAFKSSAELILQMNADSAIAQEVIQKLELL